MIRSTNVRLRQDACDEICFILNKLPQEDRRRLLEGFRESFPSVRWYIIHDGRINAEAD